MNTLPIALGASGSTGAVSEDRVPGIETVDAGDVKRLKGIAKYVIEGGKALVDFVDYSRDEARRAGVETLAVELSGILAARRLDDIVDALNDSPTLGSGAVKLSKEGLGYLKRAEKLLAEANANLLKITGTTPIPGGYKMGANIAVEFPTTGIIIAGAVIAVGVVVAVLLSKAK